jgi:hypothetical protein
VLCNAYYAKHADARVIYIGEIHNPWEIMLDQQLIT